MRAVKTSIVAATLIVSGFAAAAQASITGSGFISNIHSLPLGQILFTFAGDRSATPFCHTIPQRWAFDGTTPAGQQKLAIILTAHASGKQIQVIGANNCDVWGDTESVSYLLTAD